MAKATIPLSKGYAPEKLDYPAYLSEKIDGVPVKITIRDGYKATCETRQGEPVPSCDEYMRFLSAELQQKQLIIADEFVIVVEISHETVKAFKDVSGLVRQQTPQTGFIFNIFDCDFTGISGVKYDFGFRYVEGISRIIDKLPPFFNLLDQVLCRTQVDLEATLADKQRQNPDAEGFVARSGNALFKPNSRHWDYQKIVVDPTVDLRITGFEEAMSKKDPVTGIRTPLGMVGRITADYKGVKVGVGPGKLTHKERTDLFNDRSWVGTDPIATIKYKRDDTYTALRQPTFQHWRPEKTEESYE